jgi:hypothetical protein
LRFLQGWAMLPAQLLCVLHYPLFMPFVVPALRLREGRGRQL